jgi:mannose-6-phosphate isomerase-like protein (cupin superfamily)
MNGRNFGVKMSELLLEPDATKEQVFSKVADYLGDVSLRAVTIDSERPWGGFFVIDVAQTQDFINRYFPELDAHDIEKGGKLSPKILVVEPGKRLSWQYHHRREELWKVIEGPVGVITSPDDTQGPIQPVETGNTIQFGTLTRHRLTGLDNWGVVAEIWQHTDPTNPSDESDIVRVSDDFGR